jgi:hypothetical protein
MKTYLAKERLNSGGYNARGRYFGLVRGTSVYRYDFSGDWESGYVRARTRTEAKDELRRRYPQLDLTFCR